MPPHTLWRCSRVSGTSETESCPGFRYLPIEVDEPGLCERTHLVEHFGQAPPSTRVCGAPMHRAGEFEFPEDF